MTGTGRWGGRRGQHVRTEHDVKELGERDFCIVKSTDGFSRMCEGLQGFFARKGKPKTEKDEPK